MSVSSLYESLWSIISGDEAAQINDRALVVYLRSTGTINPLILGVCSARLSCRCSSVYVSNKIAAQLCFKFKHRWVRYVRPSVDEISDLRCQYDEMYVHNIVDEGDA